MIDGALVVDGHLDTPLRMVDEGLDLGERHADGHADLPRMADGGLDAAFLAAWIDPAYAAGGALARCESLLGSIVEAARRHAGRAGLATDAAQVRALAAEGRVALLAGVENGQALEGRIENLERLAALGARYLTLTWMNSNEWADAAGGERLHGGLSDAGRELVDAMPRAGILVDLSHASVETFWQVLERVDRPVVVSHSATEALGPHPRNVSDDQLRGLAANGGLVGINFFSRYLAPGADEDPPWTAIVDHLERAVEVAGIDHVGLGSDFDGMPAPARGMDDVQDLPKLAAELERRGYGPDERARILGGNWLRVLG